MALLPLHLGSPHRCLYGQLDAISATLAAPQPAFNSRAAGCPPGRPCLPRARAGASPWPGVRRARTHDSLPAMRRFPVARIGGRWYIGESVPDTYIEDGAWLDHWLAQRQSNRSCLNFNGNRTMKQRFISDLGPVTSRP
jgi:hypothetical protein